MKKSIPVRIMTVLGSLVLLAAGAGAALEAFGGYPVTAALGGLLALNTPLAVLCKLLSVAALAVLAASAFVCALPGRKPKQMDYVMQKGENGPIGISLRAIEKQVRTCVAKHGEIANADISVREGRDGIVILLNVDEVSGVSIPLTVDLLQRQIRQYVTGCTGMTVAEVRVMVETDTDHEVQSAYVVQDDVYQPAVSHQAESVPAEPAPVQVQQPAAPAQMEESAVDDVPVRQPEETVQEPEPEAEPQLAAAPVEIPAVLPEPVPVQEEQPVDERPLHQRIFGAEELPVTVPVPPELTAEMTEAVPEPQPETPEEEAAPEEAPAVEAEVEENWCEPDLQAAADAVLSEVALNAEPEDDDATETEDAEETAVVIEVDETFGEPQQMI
ncbi:MAG: hypothetical protein IJ343_14785 [Clostridia bacterium]|nr:hypothetical protein [Clostridia bacterium]